MAKEPYGDLPVVDRVGDFVIGVVTTLVVALWRAAAFAALIVGDYTGDA